MKGSYTDNIIALVSEREQGWFEQASVIMNTVSCKININILSYISKGDGSLDSLKKATGIHKPILRQRLHELTMAGVTERHRIKTDVWEVIPGRLYSLIQHASNIVTY